MRVYKSLKIRKVKTYRSMGDKYHFGGEPFESIIYAHTKEEATNKAEKFIKQTEEKWPGWTPYLYLIQYVFETVVYCHRWCLINKVTRELTENY